MADISAFGTFALDTFSRLIDLLEAPSRFPDMVWIVAPLIIIIIMMTLYFSRYTDEELGWNTALGNSLVLIFVSVDLLHHIFNSSLPGSVQNLLTHGGVTILTLLLFTEGVILLFVNFSHTFPKRISYILSSPLSVNLTAYVVISIVYTGVPLDAHTIIAAFLLFAGFLLAFTGVGFLAQRWWQRVELLKEKEPVDDVKKEEKVIEKTKKLLLEEEEKIVRAEAKRRDELKKKQQQVKKIKKVVRKAVHPAVPSPLARTTHRARRR